MGRMLPIIVVLLGVAGGAGAGFALRPAPSSAAAENAGTAHGEASTHGGEPADCPAQAAAPAADDHDSDHGDSEYLRLSSQFVVPILSADAIEAMVVLSLGLEVTAGSQERIFAQEPKLRDVFLQVLFDHSNAGGFDGNYVNSASLEILRTALSASAKKIAGPSIENVLIVDMVKQPT